MLAQWYTIPEGDAGIAATLGRMRVLAIAGTRDPFIVQTARAVVRQVDGHDRWTTTETLFTWFMERYTYTLDPTDYELIVAPRAMLAQLARDGYLQGDCDDAATLLASLLESVGVPTRFRVIGPAPRGPGDSGFIHVLIEANTAAGVWLPLDVTLDGATPGDRPPNMPAEATYDGTGYHPEELMISRMGGVGQFDFELPALDAGSVVEMGPPASFDLGAGDMVISSPDISLGSGYQGLPVFDTMPSGGVSASSDWSKIFADVTGGVVKVGTAALPLLERYGALTPRPGSIPLQYPGETPAQYAARLSAGGFQNVLATTPATTWLLLGGGALVLLLILRRKR